LEVHIEIGIPNEAGRSQILKIHTKQLREDKMLVKNVDLEEMPH
jgi:vesicle-fusing ATPase